MSKEAIVERILSDAEQEAGEILKAAEEKAAAVIAAASAVRKRAAANRKRRSGKKHRGFLSRKPRLRGWIPQKFCFPKSVASSTRFTLRR